MQVTVDLRGFRSGSMNEVLLSIDMDPAPLFERMDPIIARYEVARVAYEERDQLLYLRLDDPQRLADEALRQALSDDCAALGFRYIALDLLALHP